MQTAKLWSMNDSLTVAQWVDTVAGRLADAGVFLGHGTDDFWDEAVVLVCHAADIDLANSALLKAQPLSRAQVDALESLVGRRIESRLPAAYLTGRAFFAGLDFEVNEQVLIPRSPIAEMIEDQFAPWLQTNKPHVCDLCTGSGCIGIATAAHIPDARVVGVDISRWALEVARRNIAAHGLADRVSLAESDLFDSLAPARFDLIVSNPPYVADAEWRGLPSEYINEPKLALHAGDDGLDLVLRILCEASDWLTEDGVLVMEVGSAQAALEALLPTLPYIWLEFERGGEGVFLLEACHLRPVQAKLAELASTRTT